MNSEAEIVQVYLDDIIPNRFQPRELFDEEALKELAVSIKEHGVIQPIIVRRIGTKYEIIAGERRYKASTMAGLTRIPAIVRDLDDKESSKIALIENLQRKDLTPIEEARTYQIILDLDEMTQEELAKTMGKSQSAVSNKLRLLTLSNEIQDALLKQKISERHARCLLNVEEEDKRDELLYSIIDRKLSVRELEDEIRTGVSTVRTEVEEKEIEEPEIDLVNGRLNEEFIPKTIEIEKINEDFPKIEEEYPKVVIPSRPEPQASIEDIEMLDFEDEGETYNFVRPEINKTTITSGIEAVREAINNIKAKGFKVRNDELDLDKVHRFIIEIEK